MPARGLLSRPTPHPSLPRTRILRTQSHRMLAPRTCLQTNIMLFSAQKGVAAYQQWSTSSTARHGTAAAHPGGRVQTTRCSYSTPTSNTRQLVVPKASLHQTDGTSLFQEFVPVGVLLKSTNRQGNTLNLLGKSTRPQGVPSRLANTLHHRGWGNIEASPFQYNGVCYRPPVFCNRLHAICYERFDPSQDVGRSF